MTENIMFPPVITNAGVFRGGPALPRKQFDPSSFPHMDFRFADLPGEPTRGTSANLVICDDVQVHPGTGVEMQAIEVEQCEKCQCWHGGMTAEGVGFSTPCGEFDAKSETPDCQEKDRR